MKPPRALEDGRALALWRYRRRLRRPIGLRPCYHGREPASTRRADDRSRQIDSDACFVDARDRAVEMTERVRRPAGGKQHFGCEAEIILRRWTDRGGVGDLGVDQPHGVRRGCAGCVAHPTIIRLLARHGGRPNFSASAAARCAAMKAASRSPPSWWPIRHCAARARGCLDDRVFRRVRLPARNAAVPVVLRPISAKHCRIGHGRRRQDRGRRTRARGDGAAPLVKRDGVSAALQHATDIAPKMRR